MKTVRAIKFGFMPGPQIARVRVGAVVEVPDDFEADWFVVLTPAKLAAEAEQEKSGRRARQVALSEVAKAPVKGPTD